MVGMVAHSPHFETRAVRAQAVDLPVIDEPSSGLFGDVRPVMRLRCAVLDVPSRHDQYPVAHFDVARLFHFLQADRLIDALVPEVKHDGRPHQAVDGQAGGISAIPQKVEHGFYVGAHVRPHVDAAHNVAFRRVAVATVGYLERVLLGTRVKPVAQVDNPTFRDADHKVGRFRLAYCICHRSFSFATRVMRPSANRRAPCTGGLRTRTGFAGADNVTLAPRRLHGRGNLLLVPRLAQGDHDPATT